MTALEGVVALFGLIAMLAMPAMPGFAQQTPRPGSRNVQVITQGNQPYLGIGVRDIDPDSAKKFNLKEVRGTEVTSVADDSPAAKAGLKQGDVILDFNGQPIEGGEQLSRMVRETPIGRQVRLGVWRNGSVQTLTATVETNKGMRALSSPSVARTVASPLAWANRGTCGASTLSSTP